MSDDSWGYKVMKSLIQKIMITSILLVLGISVQARQLLITKNGQVKYVIQDYQMIELILDNGNTVKGIFNILTDTTFKIGTDTVAVSSVYSVKVDKGSSLAKGVSIVGLVGGTGLILGGLSLMSDDTLLGLIYGPVGLVMVSVGLVFDAVSITALALRGGKRIVVSGIYAKHRLSIL
jgi:hypothetical protein